MKVTFKSAQTLGNRPFHAGVHEVSNALAHNLQFKKLVQSGAIMVHPRDDASQKIQTARDAKAIQMAQAARKASKLNSVSSKPIAVAVKTPGPAKGA